MSDVTPYPNPLVVDVTVDICICALLTGAFTGLLHLFLADNPYWTTRNVLLVLAVCFLLVYASGIGRKLHSLWKTIRVDRMSDEIVAAAEAEYESVADSERDRSDGDDVGHER